MTTNDKDLHKPGVKYDKTKPRVGMVLGNFPRALLAVSEVGTYGANKYTDDNWLSVVSARDRYTDAGLRHYLLACTGEEFDNESGYRHLAHEAWNALARLELLLREKENENEKNRQQNLP